MGQAKNRRQRFFQDHPICCFCGGMSAAEEIEHLPPKIMFLQKHRPSGFEFPTCIKCNRASRKSDTLVSFLSKYGAYNDYSVRFRSDFEKEAKAAIHYCPEALDELLDIRNRNRRRERKLDQTAGSESVLIKAGEKQFEHINLFAIKICAGTYYEATGKIASPDANIIVYIYTQVNSLDGTEPKMPNFIGDFKTIRQGKWSVEDQFVYRYALEENRLGGVFDFMFHGNLRIVTFIFDDPSNKPKLEDAENVFSIRNITPVLDEKRNPFPTVSKKFTIPSPAISST